VNAPSRLVRISLLALAAAGLTAASRAQDVGADTLPTLPVPPHVVVRRYLAYDTAPRQKLDLYLPQGHAVKPRPLIVYLHGGGWRKGSKADGQRVAFRFVGEGYAVACVDYRLSGDALYPAQIEDCKAAVRWLRSNADRLDLDPDHIGVIGVSAGGHLAALMGALNSAHLYETGASMDQGSHVQAICDFFGPIDLLRWYEAASRQGQPAAEEVAQLVGGDPRQQAIAVRSTNPTRFIDGATCSFLIIHGDNDTIVPLEQSRLLYAALVAKDINVHLHVVKNAGHTGPAFVTPEINAMVDEFFSQTLKTPPGRGPDLAPSAITESAATPDRPASR
jgi:acetyl esterase/lipase